MPWGSAYPENRKFDTDLNAIREVWAVLKELNLWDEFIDAWIELDGPYHRSIADAIDKFLSNQPRQVEAAIKVLEVNHIAPLNTRWETMQEYYERIE